MLCWIWGWTAGTMLVSLRGFTSTNRARSHGSIAWTANPYGCSRLSKIGADTPSTSQSWTNFRALDKVGLWLDNGITMKNKLQNAAVALAILLTTLFTGCSNAPRYAVQDVPWTFNDGTVIHDLIRVDLTAGTVCGLNGVVYHGLQPRIESCGVK